MVGEDKRPKASPAFVREPAPDGDDEGPDDVRAWGHVLGFEGVTRPSRSGRLVRRVTRPCATALDTGQPRTTGAYRRNALKCPKTASSIRADPARLIHPRRPGPRSGRIRSHTFLHPAPPRRRRLVHACAQ